MPPKKQTTSDEPAAEPRRSSRIKDLPAKPADEPKEVKEPKEPKEKKAAAKPRSKKAPAADKDKDDDKTAAAAKPKSGRGTKRKADDDTGADEPAAKKVCRISSFLTSVHRTDVFYLVQARLEGCLQACIQGCPEAGLQGCFQARLEGSHQACVQSSSCEARIQGRLGQAREPCCERKAYVPSCIYETGEPGELEEACFQGMWFLSFLVYIMLFGPYN
jgi:hypothetical protein